MTTEKTPHRWADVLRAIADGEEVQYRYTENDAWMAWENKGDFNPVWCSAAYEWRIAPKKKTMWINVYSNSSPWVSIHETKEEAFLQAAKDRIACIQITFTEGDGL